MLERYVAEALTTQFGHLVQGLDADKVRLSAWKGELVFEDLSLRPDALAQIGIKLPLRIAHGHVGKLHIQIPWKLLVRDQLLWGAGSKGATQQQDLPKDADVKCSVVLTDVNVLVTPSTRRRHENEAGHDQAVDDEGDEQEEFSAVAHEQAIQQQIDAFLVRRVAQVTSRRKQWAHKLVQLLLANLTVTVRNIHVRYEDPGRGFCNNKTRYREPFALGMTLKEFRVSSQTQDDGSTPRNSPSEISSDDTFAIRRKRAAAQDLAAYWDSNAEILSSERTADDYRRFFDYMNNPSVTPRHSFLLHEFSPVVLLDLVDSESSDAASAASPRHGTSPAPINADQSKKPPNSIRFDLPPCRFSLSRSLLQDLGYIRTALRVWKQTLVISEHELQRLSNLRPHEPASVNPKAWWIYAARAALAFSHAGDAISKRNRVKGWRGLVQAIRNRNTYATLYQRVLLSSFLEERNEANADLISLEEILTVEEASAFRLHACQMVVQSNAAFVATSKVSDTKGPASKADILSVEYRLRMFAEMETLLGPSSSGENAAAEDNLLSSSNATAGEGSPVVWKSIISCPELSLQVNDRGVGPRDDMMPIIVLSFAFVQEQTLYNDASWEMTSRLGSLQVKDCTHATSSGRLLFPNIVGPKRAGFNHSDEETFTLDDVAHTESIHVGLRRSYSSLDLTGRVGSTTTTRVRILPLEIVYSTAPVEALTRILSVANVEFKDEYQGIANRLSAWRNRQQFRLLQALAQKEKSIIIDFDMGAPVLLVPEAGAPDSPLLVVDLGRLQFKNVEIQHGEFDDNWRLELTNMQVQCTTSSLYRDVTLFSGGMDDCAQQLIEPFCLEFTILTKVKTVSESAISDETMIQVTARLPRLMLNATTSAVRLLKRLQAQWQARKSEVRSWLGDRRRHHSVTDGLVQDSLSRERQRNVNTVDNEFSVETASSERVSRRFEFIFFAPLLKFRLENDVDGRDCILGARNSTELIDLSLRGIEGRAVRDITESGSNRLYWTAKLRSLEALDLFQQAGDDFSFLLSSIAPEVLPDYRDVDEDHPPQSLAKDLLTFDYISDSALTSSMSNESHSVESESGLKIRFHELYVEWNPETFAALQHAISLPRFLEASMADELLDRTLDDDEFVDAEEDEFFDAKSHDSATSLILKESHGENVIVERPAFMFTVAPRRPSSSINGVCNEDEMSASISVTEMHSASTAHRQKAFTIAFELSKVRIRFNKESRHRRLFIAEMDSTCMTYSTSGVVGGWCSNVTVGNLTFADAGSLLDMTLYREILGLKTDSGQSSLLKLEIKKFPRVRRYVHSSNGQLGTDTPREDQGVVIDVQAREVIGCDVSLRAHFSPMRFVFLQQLWFEIIDYFFEGIMGVEVWGSEKRTFDESANFDAPHADYISFTRFELVLESPIVVLPVSYCSPDYIRIEASTLAFANKFSCSTMRTFPSSSDDCPTCWQWFNNCDIILDKMRLLTSSGSELTRLGGAFPGEILLNWPVGPSAPLNSPKWKVTCVFGDVRLKLERDDYVLLQHIVQYNICEDSRHLDEWNALQSLPTDVVERRRDAIRVNFAYDKKDVTPTTYDVAVRLPLLSFSLWQGSAIADVRCEDIAWNMRKMFDLTSRQHVECNVEILGIEQGRRTPLLMTNSLDRSSSPAARKDLVYESVTDPSGDNSKELTISDSRICLLYSSWWRISSFFKGLPGPTTVSPKEVIQIGDRWYKIGANGDEIREDTHAGRLQWIDALRASNGAYADRERKHHVKAFLFHLTLVEPSILLGSDEFGLVLKADDVTFHHEGQNPLTERRLGFHRLQLQTKSDSLHMLTVSGSLIEPWSCRGTLRRCSCATNCPCAKDEVQVECETLEARASFVDMTVAIEVLLRFISDMREVNRRHELGRAVESINSGSPTASSTATGPLKQSVSACWEGLKLVVIDDSGRHFAVSQELVVFSLRDITFRRLETMSLGGRKSYSMGLSLGSVDVVDSLQSTKSRFRKVLSIRSEDCELSDASSSTAEQDGRAAIELSSELSTTRTYCVKIYACELQYNPSMVIALQRFIGRLSKDAKSRMDATFGSEFETGGMLESSSTAGGTVEHWETEKVVSGTFEVTTLILCLNKEHQNRQLVTTTMSGCLVDAHRSGFGVSVRGHLRSIRSMEYEKMDGRGRTLLRASGTNHFLQFFFKTFAARTGCDNPANLDDLPDWVIGHLKGKPEIDDCLVIKISTMEATFLRDELAELSDYLTNGMPGRGMGATGRAAKGFVSNRIRTKSFFQLSVEAPTIFVPVDAASASGIACRLGDLSVRSWIDNRSLTRKVGARIVGLSAMRYRTPSCPDESTIVSQIDISVDVEKSKSALEVEIHMSDIHVPLKYSDFVLLMAVVSGNIGRRVEKAQWDNLEAAWDREISPRTGDGIDTATDLVYSTSARIVRYGKAAGGERSSQLRTRMTFQCDQLSLILHRDDKLITGTGLAGCDIVLFSIRCLDASYNTENAIESYGFSLHRVYMFDVRDRQVEPVGGNDDSKHCSRARHHSVLVEGYSTETLSDDINNQVDVKVDRGSTRTDVSVVVNLLSITALSTPCEEISAFFSQRWNLCSDDGKTFEKGVSLVPDGTAEIAAISSERLPKGNTAVKLVLHYPRLIIVADECDRHSRGLVLEGLAMANATISTDIVSKQSGCGEVEVRVANIHADLQNVSSRIHPDISSLVCIRPSHVELLSTLTRPILDSDLYVHVSDDFDCLSFPLLLPLTIGIEYEQRVYQKAPRERSLSLQIDSLSLMVNTQDASMIHSVLQKWPTKPSRVSSDELSTFAFAVVFDTAKLGLGLRKANDFVVVDHLEPAAAEKAIEQGDILYAINNTILASTATVSLSDIVDHLASQPRPLTVSFVRHISRSGVSHGDELDTPVHGYSIENIYFGSIDKIDLKLAHGMVTLMEEDVTLLRVDLKKSEVLVEQRITCGTVYDIKSFSNVSLSYYNLRAWAWEPLLEPGALALTARFLNPRRGARELSVEIGDRQGPLCMNVTDAGIEAISEFRWWRSPTESRDENHPDVASLSRPPKTEAEERTLPRRAANVALHFAQRQKSGSAKPFTIRNRSGMPIAFALQDGSALVHDTAMHLSAVTDFQNTFSLPQTDACVVENDAERKFVVDVATYDRNSVGRRFPLLSVFVPGTKAVTIAPIRDLDVSQAGETLVPLFETSPNKPGFDHDTAQVKHWASWKVEQSMERTVITFGGSVQLVSLLREPIDIGVMIDDGKQHNEIRRIGSCSAGSPLYLPLWLGFRTSEWRCVGRLNGQSDYTQLFNSSDKLNKLHGTYVGMTPDNDTSFPSRFLTLSVYDTGGGYTVSIDCGIGYRNLLPTKIEWAIVQGDPTIGDVSTAHTVGSTEDRFLLSGERAEIFTKGGKEVWTRIRLISGHSWSNWISLSPPDSSRRRPQDTPETVREGQILDPLGFSTSVGVRLVQKGGCLDVVVYAELWCTNFTSLPLVFGCPQYEILATPESMDQLQPTELSTAESALREISSLFEGGTSNAGKVTLSDDDVVDIHRIPEQYTVVEECFEYVEMNGQSITRRWCAGENPDAARSSTAQLEGLDGLNWLETDWWLDVSSGVEDGWESSQTLVEFSRRHNYDAGHRFRRRRWYRRRQGCAPDTLIEGIDAFCRPNSRQRATETGGNGQKDDYYFKMAVQVAGGKWALTPLLPTRGSASGVIRVARARWPHRQIRPNTDDGLVDKAVYELCYSIAPLDEEWGDLTRLMVLTSRFLMRNDSKSFCFLVKQSGSSDVSAVTVEPGETTPFHWSDFRLPTLICIRLIQGNIAVSRWSGGFDPLTIGAVPIRVRKTDRTSRAVEDIISVKVETEIRSKTGGTGISLAFREEDPTGHGALFRVENTSSFPLWISQDGLLANNEVVEDKGRSLEGDLVRPGGSLVFALDVPYRQGKYSGRNAASMTELLRARVALAPLNSRYGIETTKVVSMTMLGERVRLNPSRMMLFSSDLRSSIRRVRVIGTVLNDGPTRVLRFGLMAKTESETFFSNPFGDESYAFTTSPTAGASLQTAYSRELMDGALTASKLLLDGSLTAEDDALVKLILDPTPVATFQLRKLQSDGSERDMIVSFRAAFRGLVVSLIDSAPSEICVISLDNINAIASWDWYHTTGSTMYVTVKSLQVDNMVPNAPFPVALAPTDITGEGATHGFVGADGSATPDTSAPLLVIGISVAPRHNTGVVCFKSITVAPRNLSVHVDLAFLVRLQKYLVDISSHFRRAEMALDWDHWETPDIVRKAREIEEYASSARGRQKFYFEGITILPCQIKLSVAPARALTTAQARLEGEVAAQIHQAVRKGDVQLQHAGLLGVKVGHRNATPLAVVRGVFKSIVVDALLRLDGANLDFAGVSLRYHTATSSQLLTHIGAHYMASLRQNVPALLGSLAAFGNPLGLVRGLGDGVSDFVLEPVKGFQRSVQQMDASYLVDGVARGTLSLARHTVGGFADSAAMLTETFSKNMTILTLDRRYAQKRDRKEILREQGGVNVGIGSGVTKLAQGFIDGVTGVVKAPLRGAEKRGFEGFAKGIGKGLLGLLVKPIIGISDGITDVMIGVKGTMDGTGPGNLQLGPIRPRRALYGTDHVLRVYNVADAAAAALMMRTRLAGEHYLSHLDMGDRVALLSVKRLLLLGPNGEELLVLKYKHIESLELRSINQADGSAGWGIIVVLNTPRRNGSDIEVISCRDRSQASELKAALEQGIDLAENRVPADQKPTLTIVS